ncbi:MAG TPA: TraR/DksA C4-type zinc finger protein [Terriglobales bacterium]|nr:TraR/DksA C4-type zinc finger protein [Terriglobales bacterium]
MKRIDIEQLRQRLEMQRQEVRHFLGRLEHEARSADVDSARDSGDQCVVSLSKESLFERGSQRRTLLRLIDAALRRIDDASFGICLTCGDAIQDRRLEALPWTQFCLQCQKAIEDEVGANVSARVPSSTAETWRRVG